jgi:DNA polymerase
MGVPENELQPLVDVWRSANPNIVRLWWNVDKAVKTAIRQKTTVQLFNLKFSYRSGMLFITLPSGRSLSYPKPKLCENKFGGESVCYMGPGQARRWESIESYGPKFVENIVQAISRDILCYAMQTLRTSRIVAHVHDELIIECPPKVSLQAVSDQMGRTPPWAPGLVLRADGDEMAYYQKA